MRRRLTERAGAADAAALHAELAARDPATADAIRPNDRQRILRALEVLEATGAGLATWRRQGRHAALLSPQETVRFVLATPRPVLHARIEQRFERMIESGALEEVRALAARRLDPALPALKAIGVKELAAVLRQELSLAAALERAKTETRRYAKRQSTWLRNQMRDWQRIASVSGSV